MKLISKVFMRWKNWREFKSHESMNLREEDWLKIRTLLMNSRPEFRNFRMKSIVWMIRPSHVPSQPALLPSPYPGGFNPWISNVTEDTLPHVTSERRQTPDTTLDPRCQSGPSAWYSVIPSEGRFSKDYGADQKKTADLGSFTLTNSSHQQHVLVGR